MWATFTSSRYRRAEGRARPLPAPGGGVATARSGGQSESVPAQRTLAKARRASDPARFPRRARTSTRTRAPSPPPTLDPDPVPRPAACSPGASARRSLGGTPTRICVHAPYRRRARSARIGPGADGCQPERGAGSRPTVSLTRFRREEQGLAARARAMLRAPSRASPLPRMSSRPVAHRATTMGPIHSGGGFEPQKSWPT